MNRFVLLLALLAVGCTDSSSQPSSPSTAPMAEVPQLNPDQFRAMTKAHPEAVILDVRTPEEFAAAHIPGAINMNVNAPDFDARVAQLDKSKRTIVYCRTGRRSTVAANKLVAQSVPTYHLAGGITAWQKQNLPTTRP